MSNNADNMKKQLERDRINLESDNKKKQQLLAEEEARLNASRKLASDEQLKPNSFRVNPKPSSNPSETWKKITEKYAEKYPQREIKEDTLSFETREEAISFFEEQAADKQIFMAMELDGNGKETGFYVLSCGNGQLYKGNLTDIQDQLKNSTQDEHTQLGLDMLKPLMNPAQNYRSNIKNAKTDDQELASTAPKPNPYK